MNTDDQVFLPLQRWQEGQGWNDAKAAAFFGWSTSKFSRVKRGLSQLPLADQLDLESKTGIAPAQWTEFYVRRARAGESKEKKSAPIAEVEPAEADA